MNHGGSRTLRFPVLVVVYSVWHINSSCHGHYGNDTEKYFEMQKEGYPVLIDDVRHGLNDPGDSGTPYYPNSTVRRIWRLVKR